MAILKANAYGHGLGPMALACMRQGATWLGVAQLHEALRLREYLDAAGVKPVDAAQLAQNPALATAQTSQDFHLDQCRRSVRKKLLRQTRAYARRYEPS